MSEPKRYTPDWRVAGTSFVPTTRESSDGEYIRYEDYARLKADNNRIKEAIDESYKAVDEMEKKFNELQAEFELHPVMIENDRLKAEVERLTPLLGDIVPFDEYHKLLQQVERLTKAGDAMAEEMLKLNHPHASVYFWCKAKEGGQP